MRSSTSVSARVTSVRFGLTVGVTPAVKWPRARASVSSSRSWREGEELVDHRRRSRSTSVTRVERHVARGQHHEQVVEQVGRLVGDLVVGAGQRGRGDLAGLLDDLLGRSSGPVASRRAV